MKTRKIIVVGDLLPTPNNYLEFEQGDVKRIFGDKICEMFQTADFTICNIEGSITDADTAIDKSGPSIKTPPNTIYGIKKLGISCVALANNHVMDYGIQGYEDTINNLNNQNIQYVGVGKNAGSILTHIKINVGDKTIGIYNVAETEFNIARRDFPGVNRFEEYRVCTELKEIKKNVDYLIVIYHGGAEYYRYPSPRLRDRLRLMADCGADIVLAQHSHCIGCAENYKGSYILYGQGNFCFSRAYNEYTATGLITEIIISDDGLKCNYHKVRRIDAYVEYDINQSLEDFYERSRRIDDDNFIDNNFRKFCNERAQRYINNFCRTDRLQKLFNKIFYHRSNLETKDGLLAAINSLQCEVHYEIFLTYLSELYSMMNSFDE